MKSSCSRELEGVQESLLPFSTNSPNLRQGCSMLSWVLNFISIGPQTTSRIEGCEYEYHSDMLSHDWSKITMHHVMGSDWPTKGVHVIEEH